MNWYKFSQNSGMTRLYRAQAKSVISNVPDWVKSDLKYQNLMSASGRWFTDDIEEAKWYIKNEYPNGDGQLVYLDIPTVDLEKYRVSNMKDKGGKDQNENPVAFSLRPEKEFFVPIELSKETKILKSFASKNTKKLGYKIVGFNGNDYFSIYSKEIINLKLGNIYSYKNGLYLGSSEQFCIDYYSEGTDFKDALLTFEFDLKDLIRGNPDLPNDELLVKKAKLINIKHL
jgi:hypothetical protein